MSLRHLSCQTSGRMNAHLQPSSDSWLALVGSAQTVLGPSRGHTPDLRAYRVAYAHLSPSALWLFGAVTNVPPPAENNDYRGALAKFNLALQITVRQFVRISGQPGLDPEHDDSMHSFELGKPAAVKIRQTDELVWPQAQHRVLHLVGESPHFGFELLTCNPPPIPRQ